MYLHISAVKGHPFMRVDIPTGNAPYFNGERNYPMPAGGMTPLHNCIACGEEHPMGWCRLKLAGVEHCGLCGMAHFGQGRTCPHLNSETQVATLLGTLKESTESRELVEMASKYLRGVRGNLVQIRRQAERKAQEELERSKMLGKPTGPGSAASARPLDPMPGPSTFSGGTIPGPYATGPPHPHYPSSYYHVVDQAGPASSAPPNFEAPRNYY